MIAKPSTRPAFKSVTVAERLHYSSLSYYIERVSINTVGEFLMFNKIVLAGVFAACTASGAVAADLYVKAKRLPVTPAYNWTGFYVGGHVGYLWGDVTGTSFARNGNDVIDPKGYMAGIQGGYRYQFSNRLVLGFEVNAPVAFEKQTVQSALIPTVSYTADVKYAVTAIGTLGYAFDRWLPYIGGGIGTAEVKGGAIFGPGTAEYQTKQHTLGQFVVGVNYGVTDNIVAGLRYTYQVAEKSTYPFACCSTPLPVTYGLESSSIAGTLEYKF